MHHQADSFKVFGCGLPRTGTLSLANALEQLLGGKCHHGFSVVFEKGRELMDFWIKFSSGETKDLDHLREFFMSRGYTAGVDVPFTFYYKEMLEAFPNAKVILTVRDPKSWYNSYMHVLARYHSSRRPFISSLVGKLGGKDDFYDLIEKNLEGMFALWENDEEAAVIYFNSWVDQIKREIPADRLLVFDVREGWEPLCEFLDLPVPDSDFPHLNSSASVSEMARKFIMPVMKIFLTLVAITVAALSYILYGLYTESHLGKSQLVPTVIAAALFGLVLLLLWTAYKLNESIKDYTIS